MDNPSDSNSPTPSPSDQDQPVSGKSPFELETPASTPVTPISAVSQSSNAAGISGMSAGAPADTASDKQTFELQDAPPSSLPPRSIPPGVILGSAHDEEPPEPKWPDALAGICMLFGALGMLIHLLEVAGSVMALLGLWEKFGSPAKDQQNWFYLIPALILATAAFVFSGILFYGGLSLFKRWSWCTRWLNTWAVIKIPLVILASLLGWAVLVMPAYHMFAGHEPETDWGNYTTAFRLLWSFIWLVWEMLLPVFILIWFRRKKIRAIVQSWE